MDATLRVEEHDDRVVATLDRPARKNAIDASMVGGLHALCAWLEATQVLLAGRVLDGEQARAAGLVTELVEPDELLPRAHAPVDRMLRADPLALRLTKLALAAPPGAHPRFDDVAQAVLFESEEKHRRMTAFLEKT
jgi:enoyl-CoA hydratase/carnithine racemase